MKKSWDYVGAVSVLTREAELVKKISSAQKDVQRAVLSREWTDFDEKIFEVNRFSGEFALLEEKRVSLFSELGNDMPFNEMISLLPEAEKKELSCLYRELKLETHKMKALNEIFLAYINEAKTLATAYIGAACPARGGKLYTRKGHTVTPDLRSVVFNNRC